MPGFLPRPRPLRGRTRANEPKAIGEGAAGWFTPKPYHTVFPGGDQELPPPWACALELTPSRSPPAVTSIVSGRRGLHGAFLLDHARLPAGSVRLPAAAWRSPPRGSAIGGTPCLIPAGPPTWALHRSRDLITAPGFLPSRPSRLIPSQPGLAWPGSGQTCPGAAEPHQGVVPFARA